MKDYGSVPEWGHNLYKGWGKKEHDVLKAQMRAVHTSTEGALGSGEAIGATRARSGLLNCLPSE